jgi:hypothetical protein
MATYSVRAESSNPIIFNQNRKHKVSTQPPTQHLITATENDEIGRNNILFKNSIKSVNQLKPDNNFVSDQHYPFNTAVLFNYEVPYLSIEDQRKAEFLTDPEDYYTFPKSTQSSIYFRSRYEKVVRSRPVGDKDASENYIQDIIAYLFVSQESYDVQSQSFSAPDDDQLQYYYYRSMNGTCPACVVAGASFELSGGVSFPSGDGPVEASGGFPLTTFPSCESLEAEIANLQELYAGTSIRPDYPILWSVTYKDGTTINGTGCANLPDDYKDAAAQSAGLSEEECSDLSERYPNIDIGFNMFDTEIITSQTQPSAPIGEPCSDLFVRLI